MYYFALLCFFKYIPIVDNQIWNFQPNNLYWPYLEMNPKFVYYFLMNDSATMIGSKIFSIHSSFVSSFAILYLKLL